MTQDRASSKTIEGTCVAQTFYNAVGAANTMENGAEIEPVAQHHANGLVVVRRTILAAAIGSIASHDMRELLGALFTLFQSSSERLK